MSDRPAFLTFIAGSPLLFGFPSMVGWGARSIKEITPAALIDSGRRG
jgi:hypothetical protein